METVETETSIQLSLGTERWGGYVRTPHPSEFWGRGVYPGKDGLEGGEAASAPLKLLRSFLAPLASLSPPSPAFKACSAAFE